MKKMIFLISMLCIMDTNAQNYLITFAGSGESTTVTSVIVENLVTGATLVLDGTDDLRLNLTTGINTFESNSFQGIKIYPNPVTDNSTLRIFAPEEGLATISIIDISGKTTGQITCYLDNSLNEFRLSGTGDGFYLINIRGKSYQLADKFLSTNQSAGRIILEKMGNNMPSSSGRKESGIKTTEATHDMVYTPGQTLKFTGTSGSYTTILTDSPTSDKTITFNFVDCTDGDGNEYPIIVTPKKGEGKSVEQIWMGANLRSKKYNDGTVIPLVTDNAAWNQLNTPGYCWYNNDESGHKTTYGALYNWYTVNTGKLCPAGWHVPTDSEWSVFIDFLEGDKTAGGKLKESGITNWRAPNTGGTNNIGFSALPAGYRHSDGPFIGATGNANWWSATDYDKSTAWYRYIYYYSAEVFNSHQSKAKGFSVRCVKN